MTYSNAQNKIASAFAAMFTAAIFVIAAVGPAANNAATTFV